jgi:hypothetical protein
MENVNDSVSSKHNLKKLDLNCINLKYGRNYENEYNSVNEFKSLGKNDERGGVDKKLKTNDVKEV